MVSLAISSQIRNGLSQVHAGHFTRRNDRANWVDRHLAVVSVENFQQCGE